MSSYVRVFILHIIWTKFSSLPKKHLEERTSSPKRKSFLSLILLFTVRRIHTKRQLVTDTCLSLLPPSQRGPSLLSPQNDGQMTG